MRADATIVLIPLTQGMFAIVDAEDAERVLPFKWYASRIGTTFYAMRRDKSNKTVYMHRVILDAPCGTDVDHINRDGLDNRRANIRICTHAQNIARKRNAINNRSGFRGVSLEEPRANGFRPWRAAIQIKGAYRRLGVFDTPEEAARAYDAAAQEAFGEFAFCNFPEGD